MHPVMYNAESVGDDSHVKKDSVSYKVTKLSKNKNEKRNRKGDRKW